MSKVVMTIKQVVDLGLWEKVCEYKGWDVWCLNEGRVDYLDEVEFDTEFKKEPSKYQEASPILNDSMKMYAYNISCERPWEGMFFGIVFALEKTDAIIKVKEKYSWESRLDLTTDDFILVDLNKFDKNDCYEIGTHSE